MNRKWPIARMEKQAAPPAAGWCGVMVLVVIFGSSLAQAEEPPAAGAPGVVTLVQAARAAMKHYQPFHMVQESFYQLQQQRRQALSALLPTLTLSGNVLERQEESTINFAGASTVQLAKSERAISLSLEQPLYSGGKELGGLKEATALMRAGEQGLDQAREELLLDVASAFYGVLKAHKRVELFEAERTRLEEHRRAARARVNVGDTTKTVLLRAEAELAGAQAALVRARSDELMAREQLALLTDLPFDTTLATPPAQALPPGQLDSLVTGAQLKRPEWLRSRFQEQAAEQQVRVARAGFFPSLSLKLAYINQDQTPESNFFIGHDKFALLQLTYPLFEGGLQMAKVQEANSQRRAATLNTQFLQASIEAEVRNGLRDVEALSRVVEQFTAQEAFAKENYELTSRQFAVGLATNIDVMDANSTLLSAEQQLADATFDHDVAVLRFYKSLGRLTDHLLGHEQ